MLLLLVQLLLHEHIDFLLWLLSIETEGLRYLLHNRVIFSLILELDRVAIQLFLVVFYLLPELLQNCIGSLELRFGLFFNSWSGRWLVPHLKLLDFLIFLRDLVLEGLALRFHVVNLEAQHREGLLLSWRCAGAAGSFQTSVRLAKLHVAVTVSDTYTLRIS